MTKYNIDFENVDFSNYLLDSVVKLMISDNDFLKKIKVFIKPKAFRDEERIIIAKLIYNYFEKFKKAPGDYIIDIVEEFCEKRKDKKELLFRYIERLEDIEPNKDYILERFGKYVKKVVCQDAVERAYEAVRKGHIEYAEETILGGFRDAYALTADNVLDMLCEEAWETNIKNMNELEPNLKSFIDVYDEKCGGWWRKETVLIFGDYNIGKTFFMVYIGKVALIQGKKVLHITLETRKDIVWERYCMAFTGGLKRKKGREEDEKEHIYKKILNIGGREIEARSYTLGELRKKLKFLRRKKAQLWLYQGINFSLRDFKNLLDNIEVLYGNVPDVVIIDSPDQMIWNKGDDYRLAEKSLYKKFLELAKERNFTLFLTTQARRGSRKKNLTRGEDVAEGYDKVRIVDTVITINQTEEEYKKGIVRLYVDKHRGSERGFTIEGDQALEIGQFIMNARELVIKKEDRNN